MLSGREGIFQVKCTSFGGRVFTINVEGPRYSGKEQDYMIVEAACKQQKKGHYTYTAITGVISGGHNGDVYQCTASNGVAPDQTANAELKGWCYAAKSDIVGHSYTMHKCITRCTQVGIVWGRA